MKKLFMICNAHIDPVWLWKKQDGIAAVLATFRSAANLLEKYDFTFCHNESFTYKVVEKYDPALFKRIQKLNKEGKWRIMGGWDIQPDCNMPSGETIIRHIEDGRKYFYEKFGEIPTVATNFDPFGHCDGLIQIMAQCGYNGYIICRPSPEESPIPENFTWKKNGWEVRVARPNDHYNSLRGEARKKAERIISADSQEFKLMLWGVGNHGGGPSECDLNDLKALTESSDVEIVYATPEEYFSEADFSAEYSGSLNPCMPGCYTVQSALKQRHKKLENEYYFTEKLCSHASVLTGRAYPEENLKKALDELLFSEFHDALPGSAVKTVEEQIMRGMDYALHILDNEKYDAFCTLASKAVKAQKGEYPFFVYNPRPYAVDTTVTLDFILEDQNYNDYFVELDVYVNGEKVNAQLVKEKSNINLDWAKCVEVDCRLPASSLSRISVFERHVPKKKKIKQEFDSSFVFDNGNLRVEMNTLTGHIDGVWYKGKRVLEKSSFAIDVIGDNPDPWAMGDSQRYLLGEKVGSFRLIEKSALGDYIKGSNSSGRNVRIVEDGDVLTRTEAIFSHGKSDAVVQFTFYKWHDYFDVDIRINNNDFDVAYKLAMGITDEGELYGESMFGQEELSKKGSELVAHRWVRMVGEKSAVNVYSKDTYGYSFKRGILSMNLLRSAAYSAHPLSGRELLPDDRVIERIDCGVRTFSFRIEPCENAESLFKASKGAELFNSPCYVESFWPDGDMSDTVQPFIEMDDSSIELVSLRKTEKGYVMRVYNSSDTLKSVKIECKMFGLSQTIELNPFEFKTLLLNRNKIAETDPIFFKSK